MKSQSEAELKTRGLLGLSMLPKCFLMRCINQYLSVHYLWPGFKRMRQRKNRKKKQINWDSSAAECHMKVLRIEELKYQRFAALSELLNALCEVLCYFKKRYSKRKITVLLFFCKSFNQIGQSFYYPAEETFHSFSLPGRVRLQRLAEAFWPSVAAIDRNKFLY